MDNAFLAKLHAGFQRWRATRALRKAICKNDLAGVKDALTHGARIDGWKGKSPYLGRISQAPAMRFTSDGPLNLAFHWRGSPELFQLLLAHGAQVQRFRYTTAQMHQRAALLDSMSLGTPYNAWIGRFGQAVEQMCAAFAAHGELVARTDPADGYGTARRL